MSGIPSMMYRQQQKMSNQVSRWLIDGGLGRYCDQFIALGVGEDRFRSIKPQVLFFRSQIQRLVWFIVLKFSLMTFLRE